MQQPAQDGFCPEKVLSGPVHSPLITPEQRRADIARRKLKAKIVARACEDTPIQLRPGIAVPPIRAATEPPKPEPVFSMGQWVERQKQIHKPYKTWFAVEEDITASPQPIRIEDIQRACAKHYGVPLIDILSARRTVKVVIPRQIGMYLSKTLTPRSLPDIGRRFGGRDHTTVLHAVRKIERLIQTDIELASTIAQLRAELGA